MISNLAIARRKEKGEMIKRFREWLIRNSKKRVFDSVYFICFFTGIFALIATIWVKNLKPVVTLIWFVNIYIFSTLFSAIESIRECDDEIIENNRLIDIVLSNEKAVSSYLVFFITLPVLLILELFIKFNVLTILLVIIAGGLLLIACQKVIIDHFKENIKK